MSMMMRRLTLPRFTVSIGKNFKIVVAPNEEDALIVARLSMMQDYVVSRRPAPEEMATQELFNSAATVRPSARG